MANILVIDDEAGVREFLAEALGDCGHVVTQAADGAQGVALASRQTFDLVLTDLKMPRLDGMGVVRHLHAEQPELPLLVLTAYASVETAVEAMKQGAVDYLQKPLSSPAELRLVVERVLEVRALEARTESARRQDEAEPPLTWGAPAMVPVVDALRRVAPTPATVLLLGESGTGKEVLARAVHRWSGRAPRPLVAVNCAALSPTVLESELFGHERGAFTGAHAQRRGRLELAQDGTFFLDEIGELKPELQVKLLRVLQERTYERVGGNRTLEARVRWVAATNADLDELVRDGAFREDLYHRLAVFPVIIPPLRQRPEDVVPLARALLAQVSGELGRPGLRLTPGAEAWLPRQAWPGNVRQLRNALERAAILSRSEALDAAALGEGAGPQVVVGEGPAGAGPSLAELEREAIVQALAAHGGNRRRAAEQLGIGLRTLYDKFKRYGLG